MKWQIFDMLKLYGVYEIGKFIFSIDFKQIKSRNWSHTHIHIHHLIVIVI
jgi:hypothetical protein